MGRGRPDFRPRGAHRPRRRDLFSKAPPAAPAQCAFVADAAELPKKGGPTSECCARVRPLCKRAQGGVRLRRLICQKIQESRPVRCSPTAPPRVPEATHGFAGPDLRRPGNWGMKRPGSREFQQAVPCGAVAERLKAAVCQLGANQQIRGHSNIPASISRQTSSFVGMPMALFPAYKVCLNLSADSDADGLLAFRQRQKGATVPFDPWSYGECRFNPARV